MNKEKQKRICELINNIVSMEFELQNIFNEEEHYLNRISYGYFEEKDKVKRNLEKLEDAIESLEYAGDALSEI